MKFRCKKKFVTHEGFQAFTEGKEYELEGRDSDGRVKLRNNQGAQQRIAGFLVNEHFDEVSDVPTPKPNLGTKVYICGPITGMPDNNKKAFADAADQLREADFFVFNPHVLCCDIVFTHKGTPEELWTKCMKRDITYMLDCDFVVLLPGWHKSRGAMVEINTAAAVGIPVLPIKEFLAKYK